MAPWLRAEVQMLPAQASLSSSLRALPAAALRVWKVMNSSTS